MHTISAIAPPFRQLLHVLGLESLQDRHGWCGTVGGPTCGNHFIFIFILTFHLSRFCIASPVCTVNREPPCNLTIVPPSSRPVQGKHPEVAAEHFAPSTRERRRWAICHQDPRFVSSTIALVTRHFCTSSAPSHPSIFVLCGSRQYTTYSKIYSTATGSLTHLLGF
jgi:hypothetical protein